MAARTSKKKTTRRKTRRKTRTEVARAPRARKGTEPSAGRRGGRPRFEFNAEAVDTVKNLATFGNTVQDISIILGVSKATLERRIAQEGHPCYDAYRVGCANRRDGLRRAQWANALSGNVIMQIFLGKNELGQRNFKSVEVTGAGGGPLEVRGELLEAAEAKLDEFLRSRHGAATKEPE